MSREGRRVSKSVKSGERGRVMVVMVWKGRIQGLGRWEGLVASGREGVTGGKVKSIRQGERRFGRRTEEALGGKEGRWREGGG